MDHAVQVAQFDPNNIWTTKPGVTVNITSEAHAFVIIADNGTVTIDWPEVERAATSQRHDESWAIATALLKARDEGKK